MHNIGCAEVASTFHSQLKRILQELNKMETLPIAPSVSHLCFGRLCKVHSNDVINYILVSESIFLFSNLSAYTLTTDNMTLQSCHS
jgi:hypothetical protein